jgi:streptogramin lyase
MVVTVISLAILCLVLAFLCIDRAISLSYTRASMESTADSLLVAKFLIRREWLGRSEASVLAELGEAAEQVGEEPILVKKEPDGTVWFDQLQFIFEDGRVVDVR